MKEKTAPCCRSLLEKFKSRIFYKQTLSFEGVDGYDVYNISRPFRIGNKTVLAGRVEKRDAWADSQVVFFEEKNTSWVPINGAPILKLEDAFVTELENETIIGGVEVYTEGNEFNSKNIGYRTVFFRGNDLFSLTKFASGPDKMKDIRLTKMKCGKLGVCTRPQGGNHGKGQIGSMKMKDVEEINPENILKARIIDNLFNEDEWGGANELHVLDDGRIGVLGHIAYEDDDHFKHYYAMTFVYNPKNHKASDMKMLATRKDFPNDEFKKPELEDVVFPGGLVRNSNGTATLYAGLSDATAGYLVLADPFGI